MSKISLDAIKILLTPKEMKRVTGGYGVGRCGYSGATQIPCLPDWSSDGDCPVSCASFLSTACPKSASTSWCVE